MRSMPKAETKLENYTNGLANNFVVRCHTAVLDGTNRKTKRITEQDGVAGKLQTCYTDSARFESWPSRRKRLQQQV